MKNSIILTLTFICLNLAWAQNNNSSWGIQVIPEMNTLLVSDEVSIGKLNVNQTIGLSLGFAYRYHINNWLDIESGLLVRRRDYKFSIRQIRLPAGISPAGDITYTTIQETIRMGIISIPGKARFNMGKGFALDAGISLDVPFQQKRTREIINDFDDPALQNGKGLIANYMSFTAGFSQKVRFNGLVLEVGPRFDLSRHQFEIPFGYENSHQLVAGFQLIIVK